MASPGGCPSPNRYLLAIAGLLAIMAVSITVAVVFPYVDVNAQQQQGDPAVGGGNLRGSVGGGGVEIDGAGVLEDDAPLSAHAAVGGGEGEEISSELKKNDEITDVVSNSEEEEESLGVESGAGSSSTSSGGGGSVSGAKEQADEEVPPALESTAVAPSSEGISVKEEESFSAGSAVVGSGGGAPGSGNGENEQPSEEGQGGSAVVESALGSSPISSEGESVGEQPNAASSGESNNNNGDDTAATSENAGGLFDHGEGAAASVTEGNSTAAAAAKVMENEECRSLLHLANTHFFDTKSNDKVMDSMEYVTFLSSLLKAMPGGGQEGTLPDRYEDLPELLKANFFQLSCMCPDEVSDCCAETNGIYIDEDVVGEAGLDRICDEILKVMEAILM